jgi:predicted dehydrogenase
VATANSLERAKEFVGKLQVPKDGLERIKAYGSYDELLADPEIG